MNCNALVSWRTRNGAQRSVVKRSGTVRSEAQLRAVQLLPCKHFAFIMPLQVLRRPAPGLPIIVD
jgi:hypothetical protein